MLHFDKDPDRPGGYTLHTECVMPRPLDEVFDFFSKAENLARITPPWMGFTILTPRPIEMRTGTIIDYRVKILRFLPIRWRSEITRWRPGEAFTDEQRKGPYKYWIHDHLFEAVDLGSGDQGTRMVDHVHYGVPGGPLVHQAMVRPDLEKIFNYRIEKQREFFGLVEEPAP